MLLFGCNHYTVIIVAVVFAVLLCCYWLLYYNNIFTLDRASGLDKSAIQRQLLGHIVARVTSTPARQTTAPPVYAAGTTDQLGPDLQGLDLVDLNLEELDHREQDLGGQDQDFQETLYSPPRQGDSIRYPGGVQDVAPADQSSGVIRFRQDRPRQIETQPPAPSRTMPQFSDVSDVQLQLRRLELEHEREREREQHELKKLELQQQQGERQLELKKLEFQQQLELKKLELEISRAPDPVSYTHLTLPTILRV